MISTEFLLTSLIVVLMPGTGVLYVITSYSIHYMKLYEPVYFAGHRLGEYSALCAAEVISVADTMKLVAKRGALMEREGNKHPGGMRAILGVDIAAVEAAINAYNGEGVVTAANHNCPEQIVISGTMDALDAVGAELEKDGAKVIPLNVAVANHSPLVADAVPDFSTFMQSVTFNEPQSPVIFNVSADVEIDVT